MSNEGSPLLPGRLGNPDMALRDDPRADPRMIEAMAPLGLADTPQPLPFTDETSLNDLISFARMPEEGFEMVFSGMLADVDPVGGISSSTTTISGLDGNEVTLFITQPANTSGPLPGILHLHGGGMVLLGADGPGYTWWREDLAGTGLIVISVQFRNGAGRLGPHPFPAALNDCMAALEWVGANKQSLGISTLIVSGESGGGNLSLATTLRAKREGTLGLIDGVYAQCPNISNAYGTHIPALTSFYENDGYFLGHGIMDLMARVYDPSGEHSTNPLAWPYYASIEDLHGMPPHVISVNQLDPLRDEGLAYFHKLLEAGVDVNSRTVNGTSHAGDCIFRQAMPEVYFSTVRDIFSFANSL